MNCQASIDVLLWLIRNNVKMPKASFVSQSIIEKKYGSENLI